MNLRKKTLYAKIINYLTKKGNKKLAKRIFDLALLNASRVLNTGSFKLLSTVFDKLTVAVEIRDITKKGKVYHIPFPIQKSRQQYLSIKWFFNAVFQDKRECSLDEKIYSELVYIMKDNNKSKALLLKKKNNEIAFQNRSQIHYRW